MTNIDFSNNDNRCLGNILRLRSEVSADACFLQEQDQSLSYSTVNQRVNSVVSGLAELGIAPGERIIIYMHNCLEFVFLALAANKLGVVWVPINTDYKGQWLSEAILSSRAKALFCNAALLPRIQELSLPEPIEHLVVHSLPPQTAPLTKFANNTHNLEKLLTAPALEPDMSHIHYGDTSAILWTSGTTGKSKGVMQNHNVWVAAAENNNLDYNTHAGDVAYNCLPMYNSAAWVANIYRSMMAGITCALGESFSVSNFWQSIRHYNATQTITLGAMHMFLWNAPRQPDDADNPLRMANMVPMPEDIIGPFCERFGMEGILQGYGQSEVMLLLSRKNSPEKKWKANSLGAVAKGIEVKLFDDDNNEVAAGDIGEFCIKEVTAHRIFNGYFDNPEANANAYTGDWYHTGDLGLKDADGDYFFIDRKKDVLRYKGRNISSLQIETIAMRHPSVQGAAVYAVPATELSTEDEIKMDVVLNEGEQLEEQVLARFINDNAPYFCVPRYIEKVAELPYTPSNRVQKYKLRSQPIGKNVWDRLSTNFELVR